MSFFFKLFQPASPNEKELFQANLNQAIELIKKNHSVVALKVLETIDTGKVTIQSFFDLSYEHYLEIVQDMEEELQISLSDHFPPSAATVRQIEGYLDGIIFNNNAIYINAHKSVEEMASTIVHEISHFLNNRLFNAENKAHDFNQASYRDEVRSFIAEKTFERDGQCLRRSDIKKIHARVTQSYASFVTPETKAAGYVFSYFDQHF